MRSNTDRVSLAAVLLAVCCSLFSCGFHEPALRDLSSDVSQYPTPQWAGALEASAPESGRGLKVARLDEKELLVSLQNSDTHEFVSNLVVEYDIAAKIIDTGTTEQVPDSGSGDWRLVFTQGLMNRELKCIGGNYEGVLLDTNCLRLQGKNLASVEYSPSREFLLVISADGEHPSPRSTLFGPGSPTSNAYGQHYLQVISMESRDFVGPSRSLPFETARERGTADWLADGVILVAPYSREWISILRVEDLRTSVHE